ncbi:O-antigen ligase family protein [Flavobacterium sp. CYK-55]|uniref:O-antigen ligase family protein n=1 Tax=Flavobacterium sp. CYK-55 TaxID=2835529 RepID=UPI001BCDD153|nr:O-antigen ligase family protein [Flavobacterium sp. CYK-55]MBS7787756.1 O-antigen ligase family protein [Flavobacterium sp. CYK-55]
MIISQFAVNSNKAENKKLFLLLLHSLLGLLVYYFHWLSIAYGVALLSFGLIYIILAKNQKNQVLEMVSYLAGAEIFLRMTRGNLLYEYGRYGVMLFFVLGLFYSGFNQKTRWFFLSLILLIPGFLISFFSSVIVQDIHYVFVLIGPLVTVIASVYTCEKQINMDQLQNILFLFLLPVTSCISFLILDYPDVKEIYYNMESNFLFTGNFGPNQMATVLGLCVFIIFGRILVQQLSLIYSVVYFLLMTYIFYRCMLTFSRGGMITGLIICTILVFQIFRSSAYSDEIRQKLKIAVGLAAIATVFLTFQSDGFIIKRYAILVGLSDKSDASKIDRQHLMSYELKLFKSAPVFGVGVGKGIQNSQNYFGETVSSHNEITRLLAEHGLLGLGSFLVLLILPILINYKNTQNLYFWSFYLFWLLTIAHSGMRLAAPSFIYALTLLNVRTNSSQPISSEV